MPSAPSRDPSPRARSDETRRRFAALVLESRVALVAYLLHRGTDRDRAEDCVQEALVRAYGSLPSLESWETARGWLFGIARHVFLDDTRRRAGTRRVEPMESEAAPAAVEPDADRALDGKRISQTVARAVERLEPPKPEILQLHYGAGLLVEEIAEALGMPEATVKTHLRRARMALRKQLVCEGVHHA